MRAGAELLWLDHLGFTVSATYGVRYFGSTDPVVVRSSTDYNTGVGGRVALTDIYALPETDQFLAVNLGLLIFL